MKRSILLLLTAPLLALTACMGSTTAAPARPSTTPPPAGPSVTSTPAITVGAIIVRADDAVDRASAAYARAKPTIDLLVGLLPSQYAAPVLAAQSSVERALRGAKSASTAAAQLVELRNAEKAMHEIETRIAL